MRDVFAGQVALQGAPHDLAVNAARAHRLCLDRGQPQRRCNPGDLLAPRLGVVLTLVVVSVVHASITQCGVDRLMQQDVLGEPGAELLDLPGVTARVEQRRVEGDAALQEVWPRRPPWGVRPPDDAVVAQSAVEVGGVEPGPGVGGPAAGVAPNRFSRAAWPGRLIVVVCVPAKVLQVTPRNWAPGIRH